LGILDPPGAVAAQVDDRAEFDVGFLPAALADQVDLEIGAARREGITRHAAAKIAGREDSAVVRAIVAGHGDQDRKSVGQGETGVQPCALPISWGSLLRPVRSPRRLMIGPNLTSVFCPRRWRIRSTWKLVPRVEKE